MIDFEDFEKIDIRCGTIIKATEHEKAHNAAYILHIDFGKLGEKVSSAQLTENYQPAELLGVQVVAVVNFPPKRIAGLKSEVLVLGVLNEESGTVLLTPERRVKNGSRIA
ncbi:tRNA-binding protein [Balneolaceae bacterium YR4-1]|uniref:tRNA-binding protein n=1 Tax=Halalkalibaculum roseum TaxID=2709311 RepID=A0A6M1T004_9BACT|nr:tRNA-binding protein [Halalkalibaculum roseum]NGP77446.1 tRNA-binding protein [Halalkalibaculum roseum]